jgi:hypothetical protein
MLKELTQSKNIPQLVLAIVLVAYLLMDMHLPRNVSTTLNTRLGKIAIVVVALILLLNTNPVVGVLALLAAYKVMTNAEKKINEVRSSMLDFLPVDEYKGKFFTAENQFPVTLEEQVVKKMAPLVHYPNLKPASYKPVMADDNNATTLN